MITDEQNQAWREHLPTLIADGTLTPMTERIRLPGCKCPFPSQESANHATNCIHYRGDTTMSDPQPPTTLPDPADDLLESLQREDAPTRALRDPNHHTLRQAIEWAELNLDEEDISGARACSRFREWLMAQGWEFRPLDSAPAPGIHQAAMVERMARTRIRIYTLSRPAGRTAEKQQPIADRLAADAHLWKDWAEWCQYHGNDDAGHEYDDLAEDCMRAVVAWQGS